MSRAHKNGLWPFEDGDDDEEVYELLCWDLPGYKKVRSVTSRGPAFYRVNSPFLYIIFFFPPGRYAVTVRGVVEIISV